MNINTKELASYAAIIVVCFTLGIAGYEGWRMLNKGPAKTAADTSAHFVKVSKKIVMYSTQWCPYCQQARAYFQAHNIDYLERDIEQGDSHIDGLYQTIGRNGVPQIVIGNEILHGFDQQLVAQTLVENQLL